MADIADVMQAMGLICQSALYPNGTAQPSIAGVTCTIRSGWPTATEIDTAMAAGQVLVSIYPMGAEKRTTRFPRTPAQVSVVSPTTLQGTISANNSQLTLSGSIAIPQNFGCAISGLPFSIAILSNDTLATIATRLAALIAIMFPGCTANGAVITLPAGARFTASAAGGLANTLTETRRQERQFMLTIWAPPSPMPAAPNVLREAIGVALDQAFAAITRLTYADGTDGRIVYEQTLLSDEGEKQRIYRRSIIYSIEYATTLAGTVAQITVMSETLGGGVDTTYPVTQEYSQ